MVTNLEIPVIMKKSLFYIAAAALALVSCNEEELVQVPVNQVNGVLTVAFEQDGATRTTITSSEDKSNTLAWSEGDEIAVFGETAVKYTISDVKAGIFQVANGATAPTEITGVAFPYSANASLNGSTLTMTLPSEIDQTTAGELDLPMWATVSEGNITLKHLAGVLKVNLAEVPAGYNTLTVTADKPISGSFSAELKEGEYPVLASASAESGNTVTVKFTESSSPILYLPLPVDEYNSIVVSVSGTDKEPKVLKQWTSRSVVRAQVYATSVTDYTSVMTAKELKAAVTKSGEVKLGANVTLDETLNISNDVTLNLNGKTLAGAFREPCIKSSGNLSISNGYITNDGGAVLTTGGTLNMTDCYVTMTKGYRENAVEITGDTKAVITGGWYKSTETLAAGEGTDWYGIGIVDGEVELNTTVEGTFGGGVTLAPQSGNRPNVTITGGSYSGTIHHGLNMNGGDLTLNGNIEFDGKGGDIRVYTYTGTINGVGFGTEGDKTYTLETLMSFINNKEQQGDEDKK